jgi:tRNA threonylcarbamoyladenosine biosynthesis protein TsaE
VDSYEVVSRGARETRDVGSVLGRLAEPGDTILMQGELGAGKTCLTQGIAVGLDIVEYVVSPTFVIVREYEGRLPLYHIDFYRLRDMAEIAESGLDDYFRGFGVSVVEWAEKGLDLLPREHLMIRMEFVNSARRRLSFGASGSRYQEMLSRFARAATDTPVARR